MSFAQLTSLTYNSLMVIIETTIFTKIITSLLSDDEYRKLQNEIIQTPAIGKIISGSGGIRKVRWKLQGRGKRGGARVLYYWANNENQIFMLFAYPKNEIENITKEQLSILKKAVETEFKNEK